MELYSLFKSIAFKTDPEKAHDLALSMFERFPQAARLMPRAKPDQKYRLNDGHQTWNFPVGLAAGFDKNARALDFLSRLGFGTVEAGTITPKPQPGNNKPRISRLASEKSLLNSMGFPNEGQLRISRRLERKKWEAGCKIGANLGKNKTTPPENVPEDYAALYEGLAPLSDYLVINISSPNTPGLRALQSREGFRAICEALESKRGDAPKPLYLKIAPELDASDLKDLIELCKEFRFAGVVCCNTGVSHNRGKGGLSGEAIKEQARLSRERVLAATAETPELSVIGAGGISGFEDALDFWQKGGSFVQIYTAFIYQGPKILRDIQAGIDRLLKEEGASSFQEWKDSLK